MPETSCASMVRPASETRARLPWHRRTVGARLACLCAVLCVAALVQMITIGTAKAAYDVALLLLALAAGAAAHRFDIGCGRLSVDMLDTALIVLLMLLLLPGGVPAIASAAALLFALMIGRWALGGLGAAPLHPAMLAIATLVTAFPATFAPSAPTVIAWSSVVVLAALLAAMAVRLVGWRAPAAMAITASLGIAATRLGSPDIGAWVGWVNVLPIAAFALVSDGGSACIAPRAQLVFGAGVGLLATLLLMRGAPPTAIAYAVLAMNLLAPLLDRLLLPTFIPPQPPR